MALPSNSVFISYRKDDSAGWSAKLADDLRTILGDGAVFIDDSTGIPYGSQWPDQISVALNQCRVFLPVIAPSWHQTTNLNRLKEPHDWVRQELIATHGRRSSVLCIPVFVNEAHILNADQFPGDPELQRVIADLMTDQGIKLDRGTEFWPAKIDSLISRIETHLDINITQPDSTIAAEHTEQTNISAPPRSPLIQWLHANSTWLSAIGAIAAVAAVGPVLFGSSPPNNGNTVIVNGNNQGAVVAGGDINSTRDPQDKEDIASLIRANESQQKTIELLLSQLSAVDQQSNEQIREEITDAVTGLSSIDSSTSRIAQAESALAKGDTGLAKALYKADAEYKSAAGETQLQMAAQSFRRLGALAFLDDTAAALEAYRNAVDAWPKDIRAWNQLGHLYLRTGHLELAIDAYATVGEIANSTDKPQIWTATSFGNLGNVHRTRSQLDQAVAMYEKSLALNMELGHLDGMATNYGNLGIVHQIRGELDQAEAMYRKSLALNTESGHKEGMANQYGNLGIVHQTRNELDQAVAMYKKSLALNTELGRQEGRANDFGNLGNVHYMRGELDQAVEKYEKSLALNTELGHKEGMANQYGNLALVHQIRVELDQAVEKYEKSLALNTELGRQEGMASNYGNMGNVYQTRGELDQAEAMYEKSLAIETELGRLELMASNHGNLGIVHKVRGELDQARKSWEQSADLFDAINSPNADRVRSWIRQLDAN